jgi:hypothetical protein
VHASAQNPWVQFGLTQADVNAQASVDATFKMNRDNAKSKAGVPYYSTPLINANLTIRLANGTELLHNRSLGVIFDTGAMTTLHWSKKDPYPSGLAQGSRVVSDASFRLTASSTASRSAPVLDIITGSVIDQNLVGLQRDKFYLNAGILPYLSSQFTYNLKSGTLSLAAMA